MHWGVEAEKQFLLSSLYGHISPLLLKTGYPLLRPTA